MELSRPLVVLDLETTGTWIEKDKIIEVGMLRREPDGTETIYDQRVNPGMPIPAEAAQITGISDKDVKDAPSFRQIVKEVLAFMEGADLAGFNLERFDLPLLARECSEAGGKFEWRQSTVYDAQKIYHLNEKRDLTAAYQFYCGKELIDAHSALADVKATLSVLDAQVKNYGEGEQRLESLGRFEYKQRDDFYDKDRKIRWWNGELYMMFGKYARRTPLKEVARSDRGYLEWILKQNFSDEVKELVEMALEGHFPVQENPEKAKK